VRCAVDRRSARRGQKQNTVAEVQKAVGREAVEAALQAGQLHAHAATRLIKNIGGLRGAAHVHKLDWLWAWAQKQWEWRLNVFHYSAYMTQLGNRRRWEDALKLYGAMKQAGVEPDVVTPSSPLVKMAASGSRRRRRSRQ